MNRFNERDTDITERLDAMAQEVYERDRLYGMSVSGMLGEARLEIERLRDELKKEMFRSHVVSMRRQKRK